MNIGIDISQIVYKGSGVARFTEGLVYSVLKYDTENTWTFVFFGLRQQLDAMLVHEIHQSRHRLVRRPLPPKILGLLHNTMHTQSTPLTFAGINLQQFDWFITSDWTEPHLPCKKATIVHDLVFKEYPETVHTSIRDTQEERLKWVTHESKLIFADSESTAADLKRHYRVPEHTVVVNYPGIDYEMFFPANPVTFEEVKENHHIPDTYILTVGKLEPRKNIQRLIEAYQNIETDIKLVIVGMNGWGNIPHTKDPRVLFPGYVTDEELHTLYKNALFFAYPSLYEGFGYPVVEAMKYGCPVLTSNTSSLTEIAHDAALLCDPEDINSIQTSLERMITDTEIREKLATKGKKRAHTYTWERYYHTLISSLDVNNV